jgi:phosphoglycolate phosphatase-like HAD superfamily hydrolase
MGASYEENIARWKKDMNGGWYAFDLDGTLAHYDGWHGSTHVGRPVKKMVERVKQYLADGKDCRIFTARASETDPKVFEAIQKWCEKHIGAVLPITNMKDYGMIELWDDRAVQVVPNEGDRVDGQP